MNQRSNAGKIAVTIVADVLVFAILILSFAWFHHAKPGKYNSTVALPTPPANIVLTPAPTPTATSSQEPDETVAPGETQTPEPEPVKVGLLGDKYADKFTDGEIIKDENGYRSENVCIELTKHSEMKNGYLVAYYVAQIYIQDINSFRCVNAEADNNRERLESMAERVGAIFASSGDYWMIKKKGLVIRNGELYRDKLNDEQDVCVLYRDGSIGTYYAGNVNLESIYANYPLHAWSFGPILLENGLPRTEGFNCNDYVADRHPRCALGYYEPGHYCLVVVDGRTTNYSYGMTMTELSELMYNLGCTNAYNLDGGMTAMMWYDGSLYSKPCEGGRANTDCFYIVEPDAK